MASLSISLISLLNCLELWIQLVFVIIIFLIYDFLTPWEKAWWSLVMLTWCEFILLADMTLSFDRLSDWCLRSRVGNWGFGQGFLRFFWRGWNTTSWLSRYRLRRRRRKWWRSVALSWKLIWLSRGNKGFWCWWRTWFLFLKDWCSFTELWEYLNLSNKFLFVFKLEPVVGSLVWEAEVWDRYLSFGNQVVNQHIIIHNFNVHEFVEVRGEDE